jgi:HlyD family secretion protein
MERLRTVLRLLRRSLWPIVLVALVAFVGWRALLRPVPVVTATVGRGEVVQEAFGRGTVESQREAAVGFDLSGRLSEVLVDEGARVTLGQVLARLETSQSEADLRAARTGIGAARATLQRLAAEEERVRALVDATERDARRAEALFEANVSSTAERDRANDALRVARADLDRVLAQRSEATRSIDVAASGAEQKQVTVVRATLLAPFDGLVTRRLKEPGDSVALGSTVLRLVDPNQVYVQASVDETVLGSLREDQPVEITFPGKAQPTSGKVAHISWEADRQTHEVLVDVVADHLGQRVAIGQRADVRIEVARHPGVLRVPLAMLRRDGTGAFVYVDRGGKIAIVRPELGITGRDHVEVLGGLVEGDVLLDTSSPGGTLPEGRRWRPE